MVKNTCDDCCLDGKPTKRGLGCLPIVAALLFFASMIGCASQPKYVEGTSLSLGAYIPWDGQMYGVELMQYVNGAVLKVPSNTCYEIQRSYCATNSWMWGMLESVESSETKVKLK